jgi:hypothetical protein
MGWKYNPFIGKLVNYEDQDEASEESLSAKRLEIDKVASLPILKHSLVTLTSETHVKTSGVSSLEDSTVFGMALNAANSGEIVRVLLFGHYSDPSLVFGTNESLFQNASGMLTTTATTIVGEFWARVGRSYGGGSIFISPEPPVGVEL